MEMLLCEDLSIKGQSHFKGDWG